MQPLQNLFAPTTAEPQRQVRGTLLRLGKRLLFLVLAHEREQNSFLLSLGISAPHSGHGLAKRLFATCFSEAESNLA